MSTIRIALVCVILLLLVKVVIAPVPAHAQAGECSPAKPTVESGSSGHTLMSDGTERFYVVYIPSDYDPAEASAMILSLHGFAGNAFEQQDYTDFDTVAERENFIAVYPQGTQFPLRWNAYQRDIPIIPRGNADDVRFFRDLFARLNDDYCIDSARIFVNGLSNGGGMTHRLACELADQIAAVGTVAGAFVENEDCEPTRSIPVIAFHGTDDPIVPYEGVDEVLPAEDWIAGWAERNHCAADAAALPSLGVVSGIEFTACEADVILYTIEGGGHTWPGAEPKLSFLLGYTTQDIDATETMWDFFVEHPLNLNASSG